MSQTQKHPAARPENRINILDEDQVYHWMTRLQVTEQQLRNAVFISGPLISDVKAYLSRHGHISEEEQDQ
jgi:hypothetical protein